MRLPGIFTRNFRLKMGCALLALVTWVGVVYAGNPPETRTVSVAIPQQASSIPAGYQLVHAIPDVQVRVGGARNTLDVFSPSMLSAQVNWRAVTHAGVQAVPLTITKSNPSIELIDPPQSVVVDLDSTGSATVPVTIFITSLPPDGYVISGQSATPSSVVVTGPQHELGGLQVRVTVDLSNRKTNLEKDAAPLVYDARGNQVGDVGVIPNTVRLNVSVSSAHATRASAVVPQLVGSVAPGHQLAGIVASPLTVVLSGPQDLLNGLDSVSTAPILLNGLTGNETITVDLLVPAGVIASPSRVTVTLLVRALPNSTPVPTLSPTPTPRPT